MSKRRELPEPKHGQKEWDIFQQIYGKPWDHFDDLAFDREDKITEFNWEQHLPESVTDALDTKSESFKEAIKAANFFQHTEYE